MESLWNGCPAITDEDDIFEVKTATVVKILLTSNDLTQRLLAQEVLALRGYLRLVTGIALTGTIRINTDPTKTA